MKWIKYFMMFCLFSMTPYLRAEGGDQAPDISTGIVYPSANDAVRVSSASISAFKVENVEILSGADNMSRPNMLASYALGVSKYGFGFAADYNNQQMINYISGAIGTDLVQVGFTTKFNSTTFSSGGSFTIRGGKASGLAVALHTDNLWSVANAFQMSIPSQLSVGVGFRKSGMFYFEVDSPLQFDTLYLYPTFSFSYCGVKDLNLNMGVSNNILSENGVIMGTFHGGIFYWITKAVGLGGYYYKYNQTLSVSLAGSW